MAKIKSKQELEDEKALEEAIAKEEAEKAAEQKAKEEAEKAKVSKFKKEYTVCVTGFYKFGKMFRAHDKVCSKIYKDHIEGLLKSGLIK